MPHVPLLIHEHSRGVAAIWWFWGKIWKCISVVTFDVILPQSLLQAEMYSTSSQKDNYFLFVHKVLFVLGKHSSSSFALVTLMTWDLMSIPRPVCLTEPGASWSHAVRLGAAKPLRFLVEGMGSCTCTLVGYAFSSPISSLSRGNSVKKYLCSSPDIF